MKVKKIYNTIFDCIQKNWVYVGSVKKAMDDPNYKCDVNIHSKIDFDAIAKKTELSLCPAKNEIIGGAKDGKTFYRTFALDIANCISALIKNKIKIESVLYASRSKLLDCDTIFFILKYRIRIFYVLVRAEGLEPSRI